MFGTLSSLLKEYTDPYPPLEEARKLAVKRTEEHHRKQVTEHNSKHPPSDFKVGDKVLLTNYFHPNRGKLAPVFLGPYTVLKVLTPQTVEIDKPNVPLSKATDIVNVNKLRHYVTACFNILDHSGAQTSSSEGIWEFGEFPSSEIYSDQAVQKFPRTLPKSQQKSVQANESKGIPSVTRCVRNDLSLPEGKLKKRTKLSSFIISWDYFVIVGLIFILWTTSPFSWVGLVVIAVILIFIFQLDLENNDIYDPTTFPINMYHQF